MDGWEAEYRRRVVEADKLLELSESTDPLDGDERARWIARAQVQATLAQAAASAAPHHHPVCAACREPF